MRRVALLVGLMVMAVASTAPRAADACIHGKKFRPRQENPQLRDVRQAELLLAQNKHTRAAKKAKRAFPQLDQLPPDESVASLFDQAQRTAAMAVVRADGNVDLGPSMPAKTEADRAANLYWAAFVMQYMSARNPDNLVVQAEYAEALAKVPFHQDAAHGILASLAADDLMPTARGYALLARLQTERGDRSGSEVSISRCRDLAGESEECNVA